MTDTPPTSRPPSKLDRIKAFIGDLARPFAIIATSFGATWASIVMSYKVKDGADAYLLMGAISAGVAALYLGKAVEVFQTHKSSSQVEIAKTNAPTDPTRMP